MSIDSVTEAEDIVQETFLALTQSDSEDIHHMKSYLCKATAFLTGVWRKWENNVSIQIRSINGQTGIVVTGEGQPTRVINVVLNPLEERIERLYMIVNPEKLKHFSL